MSPISLLALYWTELNKVEQVDILPEFDAYKSEKQIAKSTCVNLIFIQFIENQSKYKILMTGQDKCAQSTGCLIWSCIWFGLTWTWMFHNVAHSAGHFCLIPHSPGKIWQAVEHPRSKSTQPRRTTT